LISEVVLGGPVRGFWHSGPVFAGLLGPCEPLDDLQVDLWILAALGRLLDETGGGRRLANEDLAVASKGSARVICRPA
jgi:hypothetical protein